MKLQKNPIAVWIFSQLFQFAEWLQSIPNRLTPPPFRLLQIGSAFWQSRALYAAAKLDIASALGDAALSIEALAERVNAHPAALFRLMSMLVSMGIFETNSACEFKNNPTSMHLQEGHPKNVRAMILLHNSPELCLPWYQSLETGLQAGTVPFENTHGQEFYTYLDQHSDFDALFAQAMDTVEALTGDSVITDFAWENFDRVIDIGGSKGSKVMPLLKRYAHLSALVFDRAQVIQTAQAYWIQNQPPELQARLTFQAGNMFETIPAANDARDIYLLSAVLHGLSDADCIQVLRKLATVIGATGATIAIMELVVADGQADLASTAFDMQMYVNTHGRERSLPEWRVLVQDSGLRLSEVVNLRSLAKLLVLKCA